VGSTDARKAETSVSKSASAGSAGAARWAREPLEPGETSEPERRGADELADHRQHRVELLSVEPHLGELLGSRVALDLEDGFVGVGRLLERAQLLRDLNVEVDEPLDEQVEHARAQREAIVEQPQDLAKEADVHTQVVPAVRQVLLDRREDAADAERAGAEHAVQCSVDARKHHLQRLRLHRGCDGTLVGQKGSDESIDTRGHKGRHGADELQHKLEHGSAE